MLLGWLVYCASLATTPGLAAPPDRERLLPSELAITRSEIERMWQTAVSDVEAFAAAPGTAVRIERLFSSP